MAKEHHVIIVRGLGDHKPMQAQWNFISKLWGHFGVKIHVFTPGWADGQLFEPKLQRLTQQINYLVDQGFAVSLVGISAGASAVLNAYVEGKDKIHKVIFICGKLLNPQTVNTSYYIKNPAFKDSLLMVQKNIASLAKMDTDRMMSIYPIFDNTVPVRDMKLPEVHLKLIPTLFHIPSIYLAITFYSRYITHFLKQE